MGDTKTPHFYDFGILGRVPEPQTPINSIFWDTKTPKQNQENPWNV